MSLAKRQVSCALFSTRSDSFSGQKMMEKTDAFSADDGRFKACHVHAPEDMAALNFRQRI